MLMEKNFGLTSKDFDRLVADLKKNETDFFKKVFLKHFSDCMTFLQKYNNATHDDAYDATMDALMQFRRLLVQGKLKYGNLRYLFTRMASQIHVRNVKKFQVQEIEEDHLESVDPPFHPDHEEENVALLNIAWDELGVGCQELLKLHYYGNMKLKEIASYKGKTPEAVRKQKERCIEKLRKILQSVKEVKQ